MYQTYNLDARGKPPGNQEKALENKGTDRRRTIYNSKKCDMNDLVQTATLNQRNGMSLRS
jgi:hypothetical protein